MTLPPRSVLVALTLVVIAAIGVAVVLSRDDGATPEARIRAALDRAVAAAEARDVGGVMDVVSDAYDSPTNTRNDLQRALLVQLRNDTSWKRVVLSEVVVDVEDVDPPARAQVSVAAVLAKGDGPVPANASVYRFDLVFAAEGGSWKIRQVAYRRAGLGE